MNVEDAHKARKHFFDTAISDSDIPGGSIEVPFKTIIRNDWRVIQGRRWKFPLKILIGEAEAYLWVVRRLVKNQQNHGKRFLVLLDNLALVLAIGKGRSSDHV